MKRWVLFFAMLLSVMVLLVPMTQAADGTMTGRFSLHMIKAETIEVGDVPGHVLGIAQQTGVVFYSTGEVARKTNTDTFDYVKGKGTFVDYSYYTHQDGSILFTKGGGTTIPLDGGKGTALEGIFECTGAG